MAIFRAYDKLNNKMHFGRDFWVDGDGDIAIIEFDGIIKYVDWDLMQSTGSFNEDDVEIFTGDIVETMDGVIQQIVWSDGNACFAAQNVSDNMEQFAISFTDKVIGNIHQNPELLEVK